MDTLRHGSLPISDVTNAIRKALEDRYTDQGLPVPDDVDWPKEAGSFLASIESNGFTIVRREDYAR